MGGILGVGGFLQSILSPLHMSHRAHSSSSLAANVGLLSALTYVAYKRREMAWDRRIVAASVACTLALFGAEGWVESVHLIFSLSVLKSDTLTPSSAFLPRNTSTLPRVGQRLSAQSKKVQRYGCTPKRLFCVLV